MIWKKYISDILCKIIADVKSTLSEFKLFNIIESIEHLLCFCDQLKMLQHVFGGSAWCWCVILESLEY